MATATMATLSAKVKPEEKTPKKEEVHDNATQKQEECNQKCCCCNRDGEKKCCQCCCCNCASKKKCCQSCCACRMACFIGMFLITILFAVGFVFYLIIRDVVLVVSVHVQDPTVTFDLCKTDVNECLHNIYQAVKPYSSPYALISFLHAKGYVNQVSLFVKQTHYSLGASGMWYTKGSGHF